MSMRASPTAIGAFVVGAVAVLLVAVLVWGGTGLFRTKLTYVLFFDATVTGLNKGAPVLARGVKVGEVTDVQLRWTPSSRVHRHRPEAVRNSRPTRAENRAGGAEDGLRAHFCETSTGVLWWPSTSARHAIVLRSVTGGYRSCRPSGRYRGLDGGSSSRIRSEDSLDQIGGRCGDLDVRRLPPQGDQDLFGTLTPPSPTPDVVRRVDAQIDPLLAELKGTLARLDTALDAARKLVLHVDSRVDPLATPAEAALKTAQAALEDMRRVVAKLDPQVDPLLTSLRSTSDTARAALERAQLTLGSVDRTLGSVDRTLEQESPLGFELFQTLREFRAAALALRSLADYLERVPDAPVYGVRRPPGDAK
jgi:paraquat-inducible protein B